MSNPAGEASLTAAQLLTRMDRMLRLMEQFLERVATAGPAR